VLEAPVELAFWNHMLDSHQLFLNFRQRQELKLQMYNKTAKKINIGWNRLCQEEEEKKEEEEMDEDENKKMKEEEENKIQRR
jgi:hypothetical protein